MRQISDVTVIIPTRNRRDWLAQAIDSVLRQQDVAVEVVVVDESSDDGTAELIGSLTDNRVKLIRHDRPLGVARARNAGVAVATGSWVGFLDDDDLWAPTNARHQLDAAAAAAAGWVACAHVVVDAARRPLHVVDVPAPRELAPTLRRRCPIGSPSCVLVRAEVLRTVQGFDERFHVLADWDLWLRLSGTAPVACVHDALVAYTEHDGSMQVTAARRSLREYRVLRGKYRASRWGRSEVSSPEYLRWVASRMVVGGRSAEGAGVYIRSAFTSREWRDLVRAARAIPGDEARRARYRLTDSADLAIPWLERYQSPPR